MKIEPRTRLSIIATKRAEPDISNAEIGRRFGINSKRIWEILHEANMLKSKSELAIARESVRQAKVRAIRARLEAML